MSKNIPEPVIPTPTYVSGNNGTASSSNVPYMQSIYNNPAANPYGYNPNANMYEQAFAMRGAMNAQRRQFFEKRLKEKLPVPYVIFHIILLIVLGLVDIVFQTLQIIFKFGLYYVGSGYWVPAYYVILIVLSVFLIIKRNYCIYVVLGILNMIGIFISVAGLLMVNLIGIFSCSTTSGFSCNSSYIFVPVILMVSGILGAIAIAAFVMTLTCCLVGCQNGSTRRVGGSYY